MTIAGKNETVIKQHKIERTAVEHPPRVSMLSRFNRFLIFLSYTCAYAGAAVTLRRCDIMYGAARIGSDHSRGATMRILVVEDEEAIAAFLVDGLTKAGYAVDQASTGAEALYWIGIAAYDVIVLDIMLPDMDGFAVCADVRSRDVLAPVLMLTARDAIEDRVTGLDCGADDYLVKPFAFPELLARIRALLRREPTLKGTVLQLADLTLDTVTRQVRRSAQRIPLTSKEYSVLEFLMRHPYQTFTRAAIAEHVWNYDFDNISNLIDVYVHTLRRKLDGGQHTKLLHTVWGVGYRLGIDPS
jgi:DNA-binding response OmpR family regulator